MLIYMATNKVNGKEYVGQTVGNLEHRKREHLRKGNYFHSALLKYGKDNFDWEVLHDNINNIEDLNKLEIYYIDLYDTFNNGYNLTKGGEGTSGYNGQCVGKRNPNYGGKITGQPAIKKKISNSLIKSGKVKGKNNPMYGVCRYGKDAIHAHPVMINGVRYHTKKQAEKETGISLYLINKRIKANNIDYRRDV